MIERELKLEIKVEEEKAFIKRLREFNPMMKRELYNTLLRVANTEEKIFKATTGFTDRTGKLRRSFYAVAVFRPLGIIVGSLDPKAIYVAYAHGTWPGSWWLSYKREARSRILKAIERRIRKIEKKWVKEEGEKGS